MKTKNIYRIITAVLLAFTMFACSNLGDSQNKAAPANGKASVTVQLGESAKTIMPSYDNGDFTSIVLSGAFDGGTSKTLKEWTSYADLCNATKGKVKDLEVGAWDFSIECKIGDKVAFTGTLTQPLEAGDNTLAFDLQNPNGNGEIKVTLAIDCDASAVQAVTAQLLDKNGSPITGFDEQVLTLDNGEATYGASAPKGAYIVRFKLYSDAEKTTVLTTASELVNVAAGLVSSGTVTVRSLGKGQSHTITYNLNGGDWAIGIIAPASFTEYDEVVLPTKEHIAVRDGYLFEGWYDNDACIGSVITEISAGTVVNVELWAKWEEGYDADTVADAIKNLQGEGPHTIKVVGPITDATIDVIKEALGTLRQNNFSAKVNLDLSKTIGLENIKDKAFQLCRNLAVVEMPDSVTSIGGYAFQDCSGLTSVEIPSSVTSIGELAFFCCSGLTSMEIPDSVTSIGSWAFNGCSGLTSVKIGNSVKSIGELAFRGCIGLTSVELPASVTSIEDQAFSYCTGLTSISVDLDNQNYSSENGVLFNKDKTIIVQYPIGKDGTSYTIPNSVTNIGNYAFHVCELESVEIGNSVTSIEAYAFSNCINLMSVTFDNPNGWWYANSNSATSGTAITSTALGNTTTAATYLTDTYKSYYWRRNP